MDDNLMATLKKMALEIAGLRQDVEDLKRREIPAGLWKAWTPASQTGWTAMPTGTFRYVNIGKLVILEINVTAGTSNSTWAAIALPFTAASSGGWTGTMGFAMNNGAAIPTATRWNIGAGDGTIYFFTDMYAGGWVASGTKLVNCVAIYERA